MDVNEGENRPPLIGFQKRWPAKSNLDDDHLGFRPARVSGSITFQGQETGSACPPHLNRPARQFSQSPEGASAFSPRMTVLEKPADGGATNQPDALSSKKTWAKIFAMFPHFSASALASAAAPCQGGRTSRCSPSAAPSCRAPSCCCWMSRPLGLATAHRQANLLCHQGAEREGRADRVSRRAERLPCPQARPPRLCPWSTGRSP